MDIRTLTLFISGALSALCSDAQTNELISLTTADGFGGDVFIKQNIANDQSRLEVKNATTLSTKSFLKFDVTAYAERMEGLENATLRLVTNFNHIGGSTGDPAENTVFVYGVTDDALDNWDELQVSWENAPANVGTGNDLDMEKVTPLGSIFVPANPDPDTVSYSSAELTNFIKNDANGLITVVLRREDGNGSHNLRFHSKESATGRNDMSLAPTLEFTLPPITQEQMTFDQLLGGSTVRPGFFDSPWFGRFGYDGGDFATGPLGTFWIGAVENTQSMWLWSADLAQWLWTADNIYPHFYLYQTGWMYLYFTPSRGAFIYNYADTSWTEHNQTGWTFPLSEDELMQRLIETVPNTPNPRILRPTQNLAALRGKLNEGWLKDAHAQLMLDVSLILREPSFNISYGPTIGRRMHKAIASLAMAGFIEDEPAYFRRAIDYTIHQINSFSIDQFELNNSGSPHLGTGDVLHALALAYDWLYPHLTIIERGKIRSTIETLGNRQIENLQGIYDGSSSFNDSSNHNAVGNGGLGMAAIALGNKPEWLLQAVRQTRNYFNFSADEEGWNFEGRSYFAYGGWGAFPFADAVEMLGGPDIIDEFPQYERVAVDYFLRQMPPFTTTSGIAAALPFIVRSQDPYGLWLWLHVLGVEGDGSYGGGGSDLSFLPYALLWADPALQPLTPVNADLPLDKVFPSDRALFRDGWGSLDAVVTFTSGWTRHSGHRMRNDNSFNFYALGEQFSISTSDAQTRMEVLHSLVMVDEPRRNRNPQEYPYGAEFETVAADEDHAYIKSDATRSVVYYIDADGWLSEEKRKVTEAKRQFLFARSPEGIHQPYLFVIDDLTARADNATFSWLLQTSAKNGIELADLGNAFRIIGGNLGNLLEVDFLAPADLTNQILSHEGRDEIKGRWSDDRINSTLTTIATNASAKAVRFIALLRAHEAGTPPPDFIFTGSDTNGEIIVTLSDGTIDSIMIQDGEISFQRTRPENR